MSAKPQGFEVTTVDLRTHAAAIGGFRPRADEAVNAAEHLAGLDDAYGVLCQPFGQMVQEPQFNGAAALRATAESITRMARLVTSAADGYDEVDNKVADKFVALSRAVEDVKIPKARGWR